MALPGLQERESPPVCPAWPHCHLKRGLAASPGHCPPPLLGPRGDSPHLQTHSSPASPRLRACLCARCLPCLGGRGRSQHLSPRTQHRKGSPCHCQGLPTGQNHLLYTLCLPWLLCGRRVEPRLAEPQDKARRDHSSESWPWSSGKERAGEHCGPLPRAQQTVLRGHLLAARGV